MQTRKASRKKIVKRATRGTAAPRKDGNGTRRVRADDMLSNALRLFAQLGYANATVKAIADAADFNPALLYYYYENKEALFIAALRHAIAAVLELSAIEAGTARTSSEPCAIGELATHLASEAARCSKADVQVRVDASVPAAVLCDSARLERILDELVANAVRHCSSGRIDIAVTMDAHPGSVSISVQDDGAGLSREVEAHVFEPFNSPDCERAGLGLALARRTASLLGGELAYEPREERGARFRLRIPARTSA